MQKLVIVTGVSSAGKSTFINEFLLPSLSKNSNLQTVADEIDIKFAGQLRRNFDLGGKRVCIIHYNSLLFFDANPELSELILSDEPVFNNLLHCAYESSIYLCYAPDEIILQRIRERELIEPLLREVPGKYPTAKVLAGFKKVDQRVLLLEFAEKFSHVTNDINVVFSSNNQTSILTLEEFKYGIPTSNLEKKLN